jgi:hypothetical protein
MKYIRGFVLFWYDFIVGDSMTLAVGSALVLLVGFVLARVASAGVVEIAVPALVLATLGASLRRP